MREADKFFEAGIEYCRVRYPHIEHAPKGMSTRRWYRWIHVPTKKTGIDFIDTYPEVDILPLLEWWSRTIDWKYSVDISDLY
jgi:hypothetical protein